MSLERFHVSLFLSDQEPVVLLEVNQCVVAAQS